MQRITDLALSIVACVTALFLSWPYWRDFAYWATSHTAWVIYFAGGLVLAIYVFFVFMGSLHILFQHAEGEGAAIPADDGATEAKRGSRS